jgi:anthranilate synthase component II
MMNSVLIVDFNDSFTFNISEIFFKFKFEAVVVNYRDQISISNFLSNNSFSKVIVWGPGPGNPSEYSNLFPLIRESISTPNIYVLGICLGHQLIWSSLGKEVIAKDLPIHGVAKEIVVPNWPDHISPKYCEKSVNVQFYNSLEVADENLKIISRLPNGISYQFHPESIGTYPQNIFFFGAINHLKRSTI